MKIFIMTDMEGCAGVMNAKDYIHSDSRYYEHACELATLEVSAAVEGALEAGATEVLVVDGHGPQAMKRHLLHPRARLLGGRPWPPELRTFGIDGTFNACMIIGQHAMSGTDGGHLSHTMSFKVEEYLLNDMPIGELGLFAHVAGYFGVPTIMVSGDQAACEEALSIIPNIEVAPVKFGIKRGSTRGMTGEENSGFNSAAIHLHPDEARQRIREHAFRAVRRIPEIAPFRIEGPYTLAIALRPTAENPKIERTILKAGDYLDLLRPQRPAAPAQPTPRKEAAPAKPAKAPAPVRSAKPVPPKSPAKPAPVKAAPKPASAKPIAAPAKSAVKPVAAKPSAPKPSPIAPKAPAPKTAVKKPARKR